jgi:hypothetical protein
MSIGYNLIQDDTYNSSRLDNPVNVSFPIDMKALAFNLLESGVKHYNPNLTPYSVLKLYISSFICENFKNYMKISIVCTALVNHDNTIYIYVWSLKEVKC